MSGWPLIPKIARVISWCPLSKRIRIIRAHVVSRGLLKDVRLRQALECYPPPSGWVACWSRSPMWHVRAHTHSKPVKCELQTSWCHNCGQDILHVCWCCFGPRQHLRPETVFLRVRKVYTTPLPSHLPTHIHYVPKTHTHTHRGRDGGRE